MIQAVNESQSELEELQLDQTRMTACNWTEEDISYQINQTGKTNRTLELTSETQPQMTTLPRPLRQQRGKERLKRRLPAKLQVLVEYRNPN